MIKAKEVVADIRDGMTDFALTEKYAIFSPRGFERLLSYLVDSGLLGERELEEREQLTTSQIIRAFVNSRRDREILG